MALSGIQIFKMTPKKNCKECGWHKFEWSGYSYAPAFC